MSSNMNIPATNSSLAAPTPQNTPLTSTAPITQLSRPTVPDIGEEGEGDDEPSPSPSPAPAASKAHNIGTAGVSGLGPQQQAILTQLVQGKLSNLVGKSSGYIESLPADVRRNVEALKGVQTDFTKLQKDHKREVLELERKYLALYNPLFNRRLDLTLGRSQPTAEELAAGEAQSLKDDPTHTPLPPPSPTSPPTPATPAKSGPGIPEFWLTALRNHVGISDLITERDAEALKHLIDIRVSYLPEPGHENALGFKLSFVFSENEWFTNEVLTKTYVYRDELGYEGDFVYDRAVGCEIKWKEEKDLTKSFEIKKQRNKNTNRTRLIRKAHPTDSFFNFFAPPIPPAEDALENGDVDEEELEDLEERLELDYQIGEDLKERIIPRAIDYFTGKALEYDDMGLDTDDDEFDDDDDDDEEEEEEEDEEEE